MTPYDNFRNCLHMRIWKIQASFSTVKLSILNLILMKNGCKAPNIIDIPNKNFNLITNDYDLYINNIQHKSDIKARNLIDIKYILEQK